MSTTVGATSQLGAGAHAQRGAASLAVTLLLFFAMGLMTAYAARGLLFEQRAATNQYHSAQAFEAAEAGLAWALVQLNQPQRIDTQCLPSTRATDDSFRERFVHVRADTGRLEPATWWSGSTPIALQAACVRTATAWSCHCPSSGAPALDSADLTDESPHPAFVVQFSSENTPGQIRLVSIGCANAEGPCRIGSTRQADATSRLQVMLGWLPGLRVAPRAALTTRGSLDVGTATLGIHNRDAASGGLTVHAGGQVLAPALRLSTAPGGTPDASVLDWDSDLAAMGRESLFAHHFGVDLGTWNSHAAVQPIDCPGDCTARVTAALDSASTNRLLSIAGDARLTGPVTLGSATQPVLLVVHGTLALSGDVSLHGLVYAADIRWDDSHGPQAQVRGALISAADYRGNGAPDLHHDAAVLRTLQRQAGSYVRLPGSWRDF